MVNLGPNVLEPVKTRPEDLHFVLRAFIVQGNPVLDQSGFVDSVAQIGVPEFPNQPQDSLVSTSTGLTKLEGSQVMIHCPLTPSQLICRCPVKTLQLTRLPDVANLVADPDVQLRGPETLRWS